MLLDKHLPDFHFNEIHEKEMRASSSRVYQTLWKTRFCDSFIIRTLLWLRRLPASLCTVQEFLDNGFILIEDQPGEVVIGLLARVSGQGRGIVPSTVSQFRAPPPVDFIKVGWNFRIHALSPSRVKVSTETRILCGSPRAKRLFRLYWLFIKPFSGLIRIEMLRLVKKEAR